MFDKWGFDEWFSFAMCCILGLAWLLYAYAMWKTTQPLTDFDREHDREEN